MVGVERIHLISRNWLRWKVIQIIKYIEYMIKSAKVINRFNPQVIHCHDLDALPIGFLSKGKRMTAKKRSTKKSKIVSVAAPAHIAADCIAAMLIIWHTVYHNY